MKIDKTNINALVSLSVFAGLFFIIAGSMIQYAGSITTKIKQIDESTADINMRNVRDEAALKELNDSKIAIEKVYDDMKDWINGPESNERLDEFKRVGIKVEGGKAVKYGEGVNAADATSFVFRGTTSEFQKIAAALNKTESRFGFLQVTSLSMRLPGNSRAMGLNPTYLDVEGEFIHPKARDKDKIK